MHHLPRVFGRSKQNKDMDPRKLRRKPKLERRNAAKHYDYDAASSSSSMDDSSGSLYTRSMEFYDRTSFRIEGVDGEFDRICRSLGLSGPEDFAIPAAAWEAMKVRSSSDILPRLKLHEMEDLGKVEVKEEEENQEVSELGDRFNERVIIRGEVQPSQDELPGTSGCCNAGAGDRGIGVGVGGGIKGVRPPMLKPPPGMRVAVVDNTCSTWDLLKDFAPEDERQSLQVYGELSSSDDEEETPREVDKEQGQKDKDKREVERVSLQVEEDDQVARLADVVAELTGSCSFTTSNEDDSSSTTTEPTSNISPNGRFRRKIANWIKGELLGRGSFGTVYEGIAE